MVKKLALSELDSLDIASIKRKANEIIDELQHVKNNYVVAKHRQKNVSVGSNLTFDELSNEYINKVLDSTLDDYMERVDAVLDFTNFIKNNFHPSTNNNLLKVYEEFRDSDILEGCDELIILAFLYYIKKGNLEGKSFNIHYYNNTEEDVVNSRLLDLEKLYNVTIEKNPKETLELQNIAKKIIKDNPVPSLNNYCILTKKECDILLKELEKSRSDEIYYSEVYRKLKNGVETDKEQPNTNQ